MTKTFFQVMFSYVDSIRTEHFILEVVGGGGGGDWKTKGRLIQGLLSRRGGSLRGECLWGHWKQRRGRIIYGF